MEKHTIFLDWKIQYCEKTVLPPKIHRFSAIPVKLPMALFTELRQKNLIIFMEMQNSLGNQSNLETEKQSGRNQAP